MLTGLELGQQLLDGPLDLREFLDEGRPVYHRVITRYRLRGKKSFAPRISSRLERWRLSEDCLCETEAALDQPGAHNRPLVVRFAPAASTQPSEEKYGPWRDAYLVGRSLKGNQWENRENHWEIMKRGEGVTATEYGCFPAATPGMGVSAPVVSILSPKRYRERYRKVYQNSPHRRTCRSGPPPRSADQVPQGRANRPWA